MNTKGDQPTPSILEGAKRLLQGLPKVAAALVGLSGFAYVIGWIYARSYFSVFGADWLMTEIPILTLMSYSWWPVVVVLFFAYSGITDLAEVEKKGSVEESRRFKTTLWVFKYGSLVFAALAFADIVIQMTGYPSVARILSFFTVFIVVAVATSAVEILAVRLSEPNIQISLPIVTLTYFIIFLGLYLASTQMGRNAALIDKDLEASSLAFVILRDEPTKVYRLLMSTGERFYIFPTKYEGTYPPIQIVTSLQIQSVQKRTKHESTK